jgi:hypothetical protein
MGRVRQFMCVLSVLIVVAAGIGPLRRPADVSARAKTYESPTYGYAISYDDDDWQIVAEGTDGDIDTFEITNDVSVVTFTGAKATGDAEACLATAVEALLDETAYRDFNQAVSSDNDPYEGEGALGLYRGYTDGKTAAYLECGLSPDEDIALVVRVVAPLNDFGDEIGPANDLLANITWKATSGSGSNSSSGSRFAGRVTPTPGGTTPTEEPETGSTANRYVDEENGWSLTWDDTWELESDPEKDGLLDLNKGNITVFVNVVLNTTDAHDCLSENLESLTDDEKVSNINLLRRNGTPVRGGDESSAYVAYVYDYESTPEPLLMVDHYECRILPSGDTALLMSHIVREERYDDEAEEVAKLMEGLTIGDPSEDQSLNAAALENR